MGLNVTIISSHLNKIKSVYPKLSEVSYWKISLSLSLRTLCVKLKINIRFMKDRRQPWKYWTLYNRIQKWMRLPDQQLLQRWIDQDVPLKVTDIQCHSRIYNKPWPTQDLNDELVWDSWPATLPITHASEFFDEDGTPPPQRPLPCVILLHSLASPLRLFLNLFCIIFNLAPQHS